MKVLVLLSGGIDSSTALALAVDKYGADEVQALFLSYGQRHDKEIHSARKISEYYHVTLKECDLSMIFRDSDCLLLKQAHGEIPKGSYEEQKKHSDSQKPLNTYVPFRNGLFLSVAAAFALSLGASYLYYGPHADDVSGAAYPDCSPSFNEKMKQAIEEGTGHQITVEAPFVHMTKADIVREGLRLNVPYEWTWSCYEGGEEPCGECGTCIDRKRAFELNGITDPLLKKSKKRGHEHVKRI